ncbi:hypothetical protein SCLCIDRAFT_10945 [Scleroderma citrinum Foug A]|uniref:Uncharacterized protein n=1 Tax=Scleroderma citrinum Foug A TaxID=1036808 RepID=A0A0C2ZSN6_9AGAM|nr:hypothetical protein SCLCIDRAFT_10945 [Scleroderma citrinum Foug A]
MSVMSHSHSQCVLTFIQQIWQWLRWHSGAGKNWSANRKTLSIVDGLMKGKSCVKQPVEIYSKMYYTLWVKPDMPCNSKDSSISSLHDQIEKKFMAELQEIQDEVMRVHDEQSSTSKNTMSIGEDDEEMYPDGTHKSNIQQCAPALQQILTHLSWKTGWSFSVLMDAITQVEEDSMPVAHRDNSMPASARGGGEDANDATDGADDEDNNDGDNDGGDNDPSDDKNGDKQDSIEVCEDREGNDEGDVDKLSDNLAHTPELENMLQAGTTAIFQEQWSTPQWNFSGLVSDPFTATDPTAVNTANHNTAFSTGNADTSLNYFSMAAHYEPHNAAVRLSPFSLASSPQSRNELPLLPPFPSDNNEKRVNKSKAKYRTADDVNDSLAKKPNLFARVIVTLQI